MRIHPLNVSLLLSIPLAADCARAGASTTDSEAVPAAAMRGVAGSCPADAGPMQPVVAGTTADVNGDGYVCMRRVRSVAGDTLRLPVDNDAASAGSAPVEANLYRRM
jgi:hypothetical protein